MKTALSVSAPGSVTRPTSERRVPGHAGHSLIAMVRTSMVSFGFMAFGLLAVGCGDNAAKKVEEGAKKLASEAKDLAKHAKEDVKEVSEEARVALVKPVEEALPKIEEKIKGLSGESAT